MNEEQLIATLQACYFGDKGAFNKILKEYKKLEHNWNELKKWLEENKHFYSGLQGEDLEEDTTITKVLDKMQELKDGGDNDNN